MKILETLDENSVPVATMTSPTLTISHLADSLRSFKFITYMKNITMYNRKLKITKNVYIISFDKNRLFWYLKKKKNTMSKHFCQGY